MMGTPLSVVLISTAIMLVSAFPTRWMLAVNGLTKLNLARVDFLSYMLSSGGILSIAPDTVKMLAPNLMFDSPEIFWTFSNFKYVAFFSGFLEHRLGSDASLAVDQNRK